MPTPIPGQRYASETEPELGLGLVMRIDGKRVTMHFPAANEQRIYDFTRAPLQRIAFDVGDRIETEDGDVYEVEEVEDSDGLLIYRADGSEIPEPALASRSRASLGGPVDALIAGKFDEPTDFDLRYETLKRRAEYRRLPVRGLVGGRVDLIPHQLFIANEVVNRRVPRVLLADETGLGKTIEAGMVIHRMCLSGRAQRILILVPESLVHQWWVELYRRFHLAFTVIDEDYCKNILRGDEGANPFRAAQTALTSIDFLAENPRRLKQAIRAGWQLLVVDEAHHLAWAPNEPSAEYAAVEQLAAPTPGLLLLTATPRQLGEEGHFARLRLLDPARHDTFKHYQEESERMPAVAKAAEKLARGKDLTEKEAEKLLAEVAGQARDSLEELIGRLGGDGAAREELLQELVDRHGIGRVMFRNVRANLEGHFPDRKLEPAPLECADEAVLTQIQAEFAEGVDFAPDYEKDPRLSWLGNMARELEGRKILLISSSMDKADAIDESLDAFPEVTAGVFHEGLDLIERDRMAAEFADPEGFQILICSEIGSEGRNFQFAQHLVLWDIPLDPAKLEQRIGRLDRIGQPGDVHIHVPYVLGTAQEIVFRWHNEGLDGIAKPHSGGESCLSRYGNRLRDLCGREGRRAPAEVDALIAETARFRKQVQKKLEKGRDRLLELASCRPDKAHEVVDEVAAIDAEPILEDFAVRLLDWLGWDLDRLEDHAFVLMPDAEDHAILPGLRDTGTSITFDRARALEREDWQFVTWDHPLVREGMEHVARLERGRASAGVWPELRENWIAELVFVLEPLAPPSLHADRFLPPTPIRLVLNSNGEDVTEVYPESTVRAHVRRMDSATIPPQFGNRVAPAAELALECAGELIEEAKEALHKLYDRELHRLEELHERNAPVADVEFDAVEHEREAIEAALEKARPRLESLRLILKE